MTTICVSIDDSRRLSNAKGGIVSVYSPWALVALLTVATTASVAQPINTWTKPTSGNWEEPFWSLGRLPMAGGPGLREQSRVESGGNRRFDDAQFSGNYGDAGSHGGVASGYVQ